MDPAIWKLLKCSTVYQCSVVAGRHENLYLWPVSSILRRVNAEVPQCRFIPQSQGGPKWKVRTAILSIIREEQRVRLLQSVRAELRVVGASPLISDRLFGILVLHQLDPLSDNLLPWQRWGLPGYRAKKSGGVLVVLARSLSLSPSPFFLSFSLCLSLSMRPFHSFHVTILLKLCFCLPPALPRRLVPLCSLIFREEPNRPQDLS